MCCCRVNGVYCVTNTDAPYCSKTSVKGSPYCCPPTSQPNTIDSVDHSMRLSEDEDYNSSSDVNGHNHNRNNWNNGRTGVRRGDDEMNVGNTEIIIRRLNFIVFTRNVQNIKYLFLNIYLHLSHINTHLYIII